MYGKLLAVLTFCVGVRAIPRGQNAVKSFDNSVKYADCHQWHQAGYNESGVYEIWVNKTQPVMVLCENVGHTSATVIQRREYGNINFNQNWANYAVGFGDAPPRRGDFWLGLNTINYLTTAAGNTILTFVIQDWQGNIEQAVYRDFRVLDASQSYRMFVGQKIAGTLLDDFSFNNAMGFATIDRPDANLCAVHHQTGWWFNYCTYILPNGFYYVGGPYSPSTGYYTGIFWKDWKGYGYSAKFISMSVSHP